MWHEIKSQAEILRFMEAHNHFHDSCIKEMKYISGAYCNERGMVPVNDKRMLSVIIHGWFAGHSAIEMAFSGLHYLKLNPVEEPYSCEIFGAALFMEEGRFFWCDDHLITAQTVEQYEGTVICADKLQWREAEETLGAEAVSL